MHQTFWVPFKGGTHPETKNLVQGEMLYCLKFIEDSSLEALTQKALKMRSLEMFEEPYDPPEYLI